MARLRHGQRLVLQAIQHAQGETLEYIDDTRVAQSTKVPVKDVRDYFHTLDQSEFVDMVITEGGFKASITSQGRLALGRFSRITSPTPGSETDPAKSRSRTGRERALVVGISEYPPPLRKLPAVANDVRLMAGLLSSIGGQFTEENIRSLTDGNATHLAVEKVVKATFSDVRAHDAVLAYIAGYGTALENEYYFVAYDTVERNVAASGVSFKSLKASLESSSSQRALLWLDVCRCAWPNRGSDIAELNDQNVISHTLGTIRSKGKLIIVTFSASSRDSADPSSENSLLTTTILKGLEGESRHGGEVTVNSLFDYVDRATEHGPQRAMMFGQMTGRVVLMRELMDTGSDGTSPKGSGPALPSWMIAEGRDLQHPKPKSRHDGKRKSRRATSSGTRKVDLEVDKPLRDITQQYLNRICQAIQAMFNLGADEIHIVRVSSKAVVIRAGGAIITIRVPGDVAASLIEMVNAGTNQTFRSLSIMKASHSYLKKLFFENIGIMLYCLIVMILIFIILEARFHIFRL